MRTDAHRIGYIFSRMRAARRLFFIVIWAAILIIPTALFRCVGFDYGTHKVSQLWHFGVLKIINMKASLRGEALPQSDKNTGVLLVGNHISYLDIVVIGSLFPCRFIAKSEVAGWPVLGLFSKLQNTIFVRRESRTSLPDTQKQIEKSIFQNFPYVLFAEGTSGDGTYILPFRSSLMQLAINEELPDDKDILLQAFCIQYKSYAGLPISRYHRPFFGWYGDMELATHVWDLLSLAGGEVEVCLAEAVNGRQFKSRKEITQALQMKCESALQEMRSRQDSNL